MSGPQHQHHRHFVRGVGLIMVAVLLFSSMDTLAKFMLKTYPMPPLIWARYFFHLVFILILLGPRIGLGLVKTKYPGTQVLRGVLLVTSTATFYLSLKFLPLTEAAAISFIGPVLVTVLSGPMLGERVSRRQWVAVTLGFLGVVIIIRPGGNVFSWSVAFPVLTALLFSLYQIATRKVAGRENPYTTLFFTAFVGAMLTTLGLPFAWQTPLWWQWGVMLMIGLLGGTGHYLMIRAVEHASPMALAPFVYSQLVWSTLLAWIAFGDLPDGVSLLGMAVIVLAGMLAVNWQRMRRASDQTPSH